jgi:hypothetical protein
MELAIARNPHLEPKHQRRLSEALMSEQRQLQGIKDDKLDRAGLARLKEVMRQNSKMIKVK